MAASCSLGVSSPDSCTTNEQCARAFGFGFACGEDGLCAQVRVHPRCEKTFPTDLLTNPDAHRDRIVFGNLMDRSLETHLARERSAQLAITQANEVGGIEGQSLGVVFCTIQEDSAFDSLTRNEAAVDAATYLASELSVPAIIGPAASSDTESVFTAIRDLGTLVISPSATSPALTDIDVTAPTDGNPGRLWRTAPPDSLQGAAIAQDMDSRFVDNVAVIHVTGAYGEGLAREFQQRFAGSTTLFPFDTDTARNDAVDTAGRDASFDEVLFIASQTTDAVAFLNSAQLQSGYDAKGIFLTDGAANQDFLTMTVAASSRYPQIRGSRPSVPEGFVYDSFVGAYGAEYSGQDVSQYSFTAHAYDAAWLVVYGTAWAVVREGGVVSGTTIGRGMRQLSAGRAFEIRSSTLQGIINSFMEGSGVDLTGASGSLDYDPATEETVAPIDIWTISFDGSSIQTVDTVTP